MRNFYDKQNERYAAFKVELSMEFSTPLHALMCPAGIHKETGRIIYFLELRLGVAKYDDLLTHGGIIVFDLYTRDFGINSSGGYI